MKRRIKKIQSIIRHHLLRARHKPPPTTQEEPPVSPLLNLPIDILILIFPLLPLISQACLALTCKPFYHLFGSVLQHDQFAWPRLLATGASASSDRDSYVRFYKSDPQVPRNELLLKLEASSNGRCLYCCYCLKLHPKNRFLSCSELTEPEHRCCRYWARVVGLCACLALTFSDGIALTAWLKVGWVRGAVPSRFLHRRIREAFQCSSQVINDGTGQRRQQQVLSHHCSITSHADAFIRLSMRVTLDADDCLIVTTRYDVHWTTPRQPPDGQTTGATYLPPYDTQPVALCPDLHAITWLSMASVRSRGGCRCCDTRCHLLGCSKDGLHWVIQGVRNLGGSRGWRYTARIPGNLMWMMSYSKRRHVWLC
ncbi:hypothetical protein BJX61DRAFT_180022 [Aspergillus egyptiacus]|nr:hypothetical protein BJX61DRAFT_180022 [Aspergillus egyptiacus]